LDCAAYLALDGSRMGWRRFLFSNPISIHNKLPDFNSHHLNQKAPPNNA